MGILDFLSTSKFFWRLLNVVFCVLFLRSLVESHMLKTAMVMGTLILWLEILRIDFGSSQKQEDLILQS